MAEGEFDFRQVVDAVTDYAIFLLDRDGNVRSWNPGAQRIKGWRADEIIGRHFSIFYPAEDVTARKPWTELETAARDGRIEDEGWRLRRDGSTFWAHVAITALRSPDGRVQGFAKITKDLTDRKRAEALARQMALVEQHEAIGSEVLARTVTSLFGIGLGLQATMLEVADQRLAARLQNAIDELDAVITEARRAVYGRMSAMQRDMAAPPIERTSA